MTTQLAGLASGFDWTTFVDTIMELERTPINLINAEIAENQLESNALLTLNTHLSTLNNAVAVLDDDDTFTARLATLSGDSGWSVTADAGTAVGTHTLSVSKLATTARLQGAADRGAPLAATADVSGVSLADFGTGIAPTAGVFTVNGAQITVDLGESLEDLFQRIDTATGGTVTASYQPGTDRIELTSADPIVLGAANDTSNFLTVARLTNNGTGTISSSRQLGTLNLNTTLDSARFQDAITAVNADGEGSFSINGVTIDYDIDTDSLRDILERINDSDAGVTATYDAVTDRMELRNNVTGDLGIAVEETTGGLMAALGLTTAATLIAGDNAEYSVNGGSTQISTSNTLGADEHGITGLDVTATATGSTTVTITADTEGMREAIDDFIEAFNGVQSYIESASEIIQSDGDVTTSTLSSNREVQSWATDLRRTVFAAVPGLENSISRLERMGIDFTSSSAQLSITDEAKLTDALENQSEDVATFFQQADDGFVANLQALLDNYLGVNGADGLLETQRNNLASSNTSLEQQIADIERRLEQRRSNLEAGFIAMETAQSNLQLMQTQLTNAFPTSTSDS